MVRLVLLFALCLPHIVLNVSAALAPGRKIFFKVNVGGGPVGDFLGEEQVLDLSAYPKNSVHTNIEKTDQPAVFQTQRFSRSSDFTMLIPVPDGVYSLTLLFAETYEPACVPGARVFDISLGNPVTGVKKIGDTFDVFQSAGCNSAHGKRFDSVPSRLGIVVHLGQRVQHPSLCGFIVEGFAAPPNRISRASTPSLPIGGSGGGGGGGGGGERLGAMTPGDSAGLSLREGRPGQEAMAEGGIAGIQEGDRSELGTDMAMTERMLDVPGQVGVQAALSARGVSSEAFDYAGSSRGDRGRPSHGYGASGTAGPGYPYGGAALANAPNGGVSSGGYSRRRLLAHHGEEELLRAEYV